MLKIFFGTAIVISSFFVGKSLTGVYKKREEFFANLLKFNAELKRNLIFKRESVTDIISSDKDYEPFGKIYDKINFGEIPAYPAYLKPEQVKFVEEYLSSLGKRNRETEEEFLSYGESAIGGELENCSLENKKYKNLGEKLGLSFGLIVFVLIL